MRFYNEKITTFTALIRVEKNIRNLRFKDNIKPYKREIMNPKETQPTADFNIYGTGYVKIPRSVLSMLESPLACERNRALLLVLLFSKAFFKDGVVEVCSTSYPCERGSCIINVPEISATANFQKYAGYRYLNDLKSEGWIQTERVGNATKVKIIGFDSFMRGGSAKW